MLRINILKNKGGIMLYTNIDEIIYRGFGISKAQPEALITINGNLDLSKMIQSNHMRIRINDEDYWIPFIKIKRGK